MPVQCSLEGDRLTMEFVGTYEPQEIVRRFLEAMGDPSCPVPVSLLVDVSRSESLATRPAEEVRQVAQFLGPYAHRIGGRCAVIAPKDVHFGMSQVGATHSRNVGIDARVFRTKDEAREWLNVDSAQST
jgi:hypothetical protein